MLWKQVLVFRGVLEVRCVVVCLSDSCCMSLGDGALCQGLGFDFAFSFYVHSSFFTNRAWKTSKKTKCQSQYWPLSETSPWCSSYLLKLIIEAVTQRLQNKSSVFSACKCKECIMDELREALSYKYAMLICSMQKSIDSKYIQCNWILIFPMYFHAYESIMLLSW